MFCPKCGAEVGEQADVCLSCGAYVKEKNEVKDTNNESKIGIGVLCGLIGLIGLIIGICIFPEGTLARKTFMKGWLITFLVSIAIFIVIFIIYYVSMLNLINGIV